MRRYLIHLSYFGTRYRGFQKQNIDGKSDYDDVHTVCGLLEIALKGCGALNYPKVFGSSRTDKGVHALCNTVHVNLDGDFKEINSFSIAKTANVFFAFNDHDIRVLKVQQVAEDFHCRFNAIGRKYLYRLAIPKPGSPFYERTVKPYPISEHNRCLFLQYVYCGNQSMILHFAPHKLGTNLKRPWGGALRVHKFDAKAVKAACGLFLGEKDFKSLSSKSKEKHLRSVSSKTKEPSTVRRIDSLELSPGRSMLPLDRLNDQYDFWDITCSGPSFLYHQVRRIVSSLLAYGEGRVKIEDLQRLFDEPGDKSWSKIGTMVPPEGLYLTNILYKPEDLAFSEEAHRQEIKLHLLEEEVQQILAKLKHPEITILEKIELRKRLLEIKQITF